MLFTKSTEAQASEKTPNSRKPTRRATRIPERKLATLTIAWSASAQDSRRDNSMAMRRNIPFGTAVSARASHSAAVDSRTLASTVFRQRRKSALSILCAGRPARRDLCRSPCHILESVENCGIVHWSSTDSSILPVRHEQKRDLAVLEQRPENRGRRSVREPGFHRE